MTYRYKKEVIPPPPPTELDPLATHDAAVQAMLDGVDHIAGEMERKWGVGRLRLIVGDLLRAKFDAQKDKLDAAIRSGKQSYIHPQAEGMKRAWAALDKAATELGEKPLSPLVWEMVLPDTGEVVAITRTETDAQHVCREVKVFTLAEVAMAIQGLPDAVLSAKKIWPGAKVTAIRKKPPPDWEGGGDEIPF